MDDLRVTRCTDGVLMQGPPVARDRKGNALPEGELVEEAERWIRAQGDPDRYLARNDPAADGENYRARLVYAAERLTYQDPEAALRAWKKVESEEQTDTVADPGHIGPGDDWEPAPIDARSELIRNLGLAAAVRAALETADASSADRSAALTFLALSDDGMNPRALDDDVPLPEAGARPDQARYWPAIWFAERDDRIFGASQSVRRRRSRRIARVRDLVHWAIGRAEAVRHG